MKTLSCSFMVALALASVSARAQEVNSTQSSGSSAAVAVKIEQDADTKRAFQMMADADVVVEYESPGRIWLCPHGGSPSACITHDQMKAAIASATDKREMAVVVIGPPMRIHSKETLRKEVDGIEKIIKEAGFKRVVFLLASAFGMPIYRE